MRHGNYALITWIVVSLSFGTTCRSSSVEDGHYLPDEQAFLDLGPQVYFTRRDMALQLKDGTFMLWGVTVSYEVKGRELVLEPRTRDEADRMIMFNKLRRPKPGESGIVTLMIESPRTLASKRPPIMNRYKTEWFLRFTRED